jgi:hypothetical protein
VAAKYENGVLSVSISKLPPIVAPVDERRSVPIAFASEPMEGAPKTMHDDASFANSDI